MSGSGTIIAVLESWPEFTNFLRTAGHRLAVVDFYSPWCGPCVRIEAELERLAASLLGAVRFARVDVEQCDDLANAEGVRAMPTFRIYRTGRPVGTVVGSNLALLADKIDALL